VSVLAALRQRVLPVRLVAAEPPREPEPRPCEPVAPVYDFIPPGRGGDLPAWVPPPRWPDAIVFGPPAVSGLQGRPWGDDAGPYGWCPCGVSWRGASKCWNCGSTATEI
jgi:hypothetical protein